MGRGEGGKPVEAMEGWRWMVMINPGLIITSTLQSMIFKNLEVRNWRIEEFIFCASFITAMVLVQLPYKEIDGNPVPIIIFDDHPSSSFHCFVLAVNFAFTGAVITICIRQDYRKVAKITRSVAIVFTTTAILILSRLKVPTTYNLAA
ncbi:hypothetical protein BVC80_9011g55 [Macleaya cordata]|uniref:Uncharacterized protein n=1 Tax=Macleaya cordata TaxID=56857 RepID=A0A200QQ03_MACCD|nr:hypothetical protein BVC80_9011g55 [Macleaya cordata]